MSFELHRLPSATSDERVVSSVTGGQEDKLGLAEILFLLAFEEIDGYGRRRSRLQRLSRLARGDGRRVGSRPRFCIGDGLRRLGHACLLRARQPDRECRGELVLKDVKATHHQTSDRHDMRQLELLGALGRQTLFPGDVHLLHAEQVAEIAHEIQHVGVHLGVHARTSRAPRPAAQLVFQLGKRRQGGQGRAVFDAQLVDEHGNDVLNEGVDELVGFGETGEQERPHPVHVVGGVEHLSNDAKIVLGLLERGGWMTDVVGGQHLGLEAE